MKPVEIALAAASVANSSADADAIKHKRVFVEKDLDELIDEAGAAPGPRLGRSLDELAARGRAMGGAVALSVGQAQAGGDSVAAIEEKPVDPAELLTFVMNEAGEDGALSEVERQEAESALADIRIKRGEVQDFLSRLKRDAGIRNSSPRAAGSMGKRLRAVAKDLRAEIAKSAEVSVQNLVAKAGAKVALNVNAGDSIRLSSAIEKQAATELPSGDEYRNLLRKIGRMQRPLPWKRQAPLYRERSAAAAGIPQATKAEGSTGGSAAQKAKSIGIETSKNEPRESPEMEYLKEIRESAAMASGDMATGSETMSGPKPWSEAGAHWALSRGPSGQSLIQMLRMPSFMASSRTHSKGMPSILPAGSLQGLMDRLSTTNLSPGSMSGIPVARAEILSTGMPTPMNYASGGTYLRRRGAQQPAEMDRAPDAEQQYFSRTMNAPQTARVTPHMARTLPSPDEERLERLNAAYEQDKRMLAKEAGSSGASAPAAGGKKGGGDVAKKVVDDVIREMGSRHKETI